MGSYTRVTKQYRPKVVEERKKAFWEKRNKYWENETNQKILKLSTHYSLLKGKFSNINLDNVYLIPWTYSNQLQLVRFCVIFGVFKYPNSLTVTDIRRQCNNRFTRYIYEPKTNRKCCQRLKATSDKMAGSVALKRKGLSNFTTTSLLRQLNKLLFLKVWQHHCGHFSRFFLLLI